MAQHSYVRRESVILKCLRHDNILGFGQAINVIPHCLRQDNIPGIGGTYRVILNLIQDLKNNVKHYSSENRSVSEAHCKPLVPYCLSNLVSSKKIAFTLAEVLITLGIIGIVAALTIPTLAGVYKKKMLETKLRKTIAVLTEVVRRIEADEGSFIFLNNASDLNDRYVSQREFAETYIMKYLNNARLCGATKMEKGRDCASQAVVNGAEKGVFMKNIGSSKYTNKIILPDGTGFWIQYPAPSVHPTMSGYAVDIDLNISKDKMYNGIDYFRFRLLKNESQNTYYISSVNSSSNVNDFVPYLPHCNLDSLNYPDGNTLEYAQLCENNSLDNHYGYDVTFCSVMIECNNWKIPENYPLRF